MTERDLAELVQAFEGCTLPREKWTHGAHLCVALWNLSHYARGEATERIRTGIRRYNVAAGSSKGYHETITLSWISLVAEFLQTADMTRSLAELAGEITSQYGSSDYLLRFYSREILFSERARTEYVPPDLQPLVGN